MGTKSSHLQLKIVWFKSFLGLAIEQVSLNQQYALTPYYFWPKTEAWEQLKLELDSKLWLTQDEKIRILNITGKVMEYWLMYRDKKTVTELNEDFSKFKILTL